MVHRMNSPILITDFAGKIVWNNPAFEEMTGFPSSEILGKHPWDLLDDPSHNHNAEEIEKLRKALSHRESADVVLQTYRKSGEKIHLEVQLTPVADEQGNHPNFIAVYKEITRSLANEEELKYNLRQQELIAEIALDLNRYLDFDNSIEAVLAALMQHTQVSRIYIFENIDNGLACSNTFEVCNEGIEPQIENLKYVPYEYVPYWEKTLQETGVIFSEDISELPADVREVLEPQEIKSILVFSLNVNGSFFGFIGFDECVVYKTWKKSDLELLRAISGIIGNAYEREIARKNLVEKNEELRKINAEMDNFVYSVSHDLRSPLLSIKGILDLVMKSTGLEEKTKLLLGRAGDSVKRLDETIHEILEYSRNSRLDLSQEEFDLCRLIDEIQSDIQFGIPFKVHFEREVSGNAVQVISDKNRINTLLKNIIGNAYKYLRKDNPSSFVKVQASVEEGELKIAVSDNGEGIASEHLNKIFDMFYRASKTSPGSGLGLYICREIIQKIKGSIDLQSKVNEGTCVTITIPVLPEQA
jgi:PAS domain S-box-containing protein